MPGQKDRNHNPSRRVFLRRLQWAPLLFLPAPIEGLILREAEPGRRASSQTAPPGFADFRFVPHYPLQSPLDDLLPRIAPGTDEYITEKYADEITKILLDWKHDLKDGRSVTAAPAKFVDPSIEASPLFPAREVPARSGAGIEVLRRHFHAPSSLGRSAVLSAIEAYFRPMPRLDTVEFEITEIEEEVNSEPTVSIGVRYCFAGAGTDGRREQHIGNWRMRWSRENSEAWRAGRWEAGEETVTQARGPVFVDVSSQVLGQTESYRQQMLRGVDHWRTVLDGACGLDIYGNNGVAVGDFDQDGFDDIYVCQPAGLPNRLYRNRGNGTFEDVTQTSGVGVLDATACALFADFENRGLQDLLVVCDSGPLLFRNQGKGKFSLQSDAFQFAQPPQGSFTHASIADYDRDGRLDIYFCLYSYYIGLEQYHYPAPYFDARNGPPNFLLHNEGNGKFLDRTAEAGLNLDNDRYSFACAWGDDKSSQWPDLYVANDFGRSNLYRNRGDGTFAVVSREAGVEDPGAGMSACWLDFDGDGKQDLYVAKMWSAAGLRVSGQKTFHEKDPENVRALYRRHAGGNSLYQNRGDGRFANVSQQAGVEMGRWAWSSDAWDFDHDGWPDLYIANGYVSGPDRRDLSSFFWRQAVGKSPPAAVPSANYELGWNAINELIRSDLSWSGYERNVFYQNNRDGTFSDVSGVIGLDFSDDSRSFALIDLDHDGRLEVILKNRNAPQLRIARNVMTELGDVLVLRLRGTKSNRDAIGTSVTVEAGAQRQTKYLQAGSGFLSQHTKELFFGLGKAQGAVHVTIAWPSGLIQTFEALPGNHRVAIEEGSDKVEATAFLPSLPLPGPAGEAVKLEASPPWGEETWLIEPLAAPDFSLPDQAGKMWNLRAFRGGFLLLQVCATASPASRGQLRILRQANAKLASHGLRIVGLNVDAAPVEAPPDASPEKPLPRPAGAGQENFPFPILLATAEVANIYNITYRYLFDRHRDLGLPSAFLIDPSGNIIKLYQGPASPESVLRDVAAAPPDADHRLRKALPFPGVVFQDSFQRNLFNYGVALFRRGFFDQAAESFKQIIAAKPGNAEAYYNLGTLYLRRNSLQEAERCLRQTVQLRANYPEAWNNLGMLAAQQGRAEEAAHNFQEALRLRPGYATALLNLGNVYRRQENLDEAEKLLGRALDAEPENPDVNYALGMLYARRNQGERAAQYLETAVALRPDYADALNNLGVLLVRQRRYDEAEVKFNACIQAVPGFDQAYLNLASLYVMLRDKEKARDVLQRLLQRQPQHKLARQALEMLY